MNTSRLKLLVGLAVTLFLTLAILSDGAFALAQSSPSRLEFCTIPLAGGGSIVVDCDEWDAYVNGETDAIIIYELNR
ncbi:MAG: hypothetical protein DCC75_07760 [Proteobacteria bacterium]|nr:MAG: hypothetical protein DCC75_07760 [Pseudomonadota bacterium]